VKRQKTVASPSSNKAREEFEEHQIRGAEDRRKGEKRALLGRLRDKLKKNLHDLKQGLDDAEDTANGQGGSQTSNNDNDGDDSSHVDDDTDTDETKDVGAPEGRGMTFRTAAVRERAEKLMTTGLRPVPIKASSSSPLCSTY
jgi:hypothetical protein